MGSRHPATRRLKRFGRGELSHPDNQEIVQHLLSGCVRCRRVTGRYLPPVVRAGRPGPAIDYTHAFSSARRELGRRQIAFAVEQGDAPGLLAELAAQSFDRQWLLITRDVRFQTWSVCERLLEASAEQGFEDPGRALELAELGAGVAAHLSLATYGAARVSDLSAWAWATLANAQRIRSDFRSAATGFARAEQLLGEGTGDPLERARVLLLKASLYGNQGKSREANRLLDEVVLLARQNGDSHLAGKALITQGFLCGVAGDEAEAIRRLTAGIEQIDGLAEPRLLVSARHNLILYLNESGRHEEALALLAVTRPLYAELGDRMNLVRLQWVEGKIALVRGELARAEELLVAVGQELVARDLGYDAALLSLDLARIYARQGRGAEMRRLATEILPIFQSRDVQREVLAALIVFRQAAEMERVTLDLVQELGDYLKKCRETPGPRQRDPL